MPLCLHEPIDARYAAGAFIVTVLIVIVPLCFVTYPPLFDYPRHLARIHILDHWQALLTFQSWYDIRSFILPNVGMDSILLVLAKLLPLDTAGRLFITLILVAILSGSLMLNRGLHGYFSLWPLVSSFFLFNGIFLFGFLNYLLGVGLLLWAAGIWIVLSRVNLRLRLLFGTMLSVTLFFCHLAALGLFGIIVAGYELQQSVTTFRTSHRIAWRGLLVGATIFVLPLLLFIMSSTAGEVGVAGSTGSDDGVALLATGWTAKVVRYAEALLFWKPVTAYRTIMMSGDLMLDHLMLAVSAICLVVVACYGRLRMAKSMVVPLAMLVVTYLVMRNKVLGVQFVESRLPIAILLVAIGCLQLCVGGKVVSRVLVCSLVVVLIFRSLILSYDWYRYDRMLQAFVRTFAELPSGSILFTASQAPIPVNVHGFFDRRYLQPPLNHVAALATLQRPIFVPAIFANRSQQPMTVNSRYAAMYEFQDQDPLPVTSAAELATIVDRIHRLAADAGTPAVPLFVLLLYPEILHLPLPHGTTVIGSGPHFILLTVDDNPRSH